MIFFFRYRQFQFLKFIVFQHNISNSKRILVILVTLGIYIAVIENTSNKLLLLVEYWFYDENICNEMLLLNTLYGHNLPDTRF